MSTTSVAPDEFRRQLGPGGLESRTIAKTRHPVLTRAGDDDSGLGIEGFGSVSGQATTLGTYYQWDEIVEPGAWAESIKTGDIRCMKNHDTNWLLGRTASGTLTLEDRDEGLWYSVDINPDDPAAVGTHAQVARGDIDGSSVWFRVVREEWTEPTDDNALERPQRRILEGMLFETGPVVFPAFEQTTAAARSLAPLDAALRAAGVKDTRRARLASDLIADPEGVEDELRTLFARSPELRDSVCSCDTTTGRAADAAPPGAAASAPEPAGLWVARQRLALLARTSPA